MKVSLFYLPSVGSKADIEKGRVGLQGHLYDQMLHDLTRAGAPRRRPRLRFDQFHRASLSCRRLRAVEQSRPARLVHRDADQAAARRPARHRVAVAESAARRRRHRDARSHERAGAPTPASRAAISGDGSISWRSRRTGFTARCRISTTKSTTPIARRSRKIFASSSRRGPRIFFRTRASTGASRRARRRGRSTRPRNGAAASRTESCARSSVVPKPVQKPHPPIFQPFASSERSIRWCAQEGVTAILPPLHPSLEHQLCEVYAEVSRQAAGRRDGRAARHRDRRQRR